MRDQQCTLLKTLDAVSRHLIGGVWIRDSHVMSLPKYSSCHLGLGVCSLPVSSRFTTDYTATNIRDGLVPQGGVDPGEDTWEAAKRELYEETSVRSVEKLGEVADWLIYDIPRTVAGRTWKGRYRGQRQKWYAVRFTGKDSEINVANPGGGHKAEFVGWRWEPMKNLPELIVPFKRPVYERVVKEFAGLADD